MYQLAHVLLFTAVVLHSDDIMHSMWTYITLAL